MAQASWSGRRFLSPGARRLVESAASRILSSPDSTGRSSNHPPPTGLRDQRILDARVRGHDKLKLCRRRDDAWPWLVGVIVVVIVMPGIVGLGVA